MSTVHPDDFPGDKLVPLSRFVKPEMTRILEAPKGEPDTYGATPLDRVATLSQQIALRTNLQEMTYRDIPDDIPLEVIDYVHRTFAKRFDSRGEANEENFTTGLLFETYQEDATQEELEMIDRARFGLASPAELILVRELLGMKSIELACLTHPYGKNIDTILPEMRDAVGAAVVLHGGTMHEHPVTVFKVKESLNDTATLPDLSRGVLMTRKRTIGVLPDGTIIKERSSFVLRTDPESGFDQTIVARLEEALATDPDLDWMQWLVEEAHVDSIAEALLASDAHSVAIPISSTIYAYNKQTSEMVAAKKMFTDYERREIASMATPALFEAIHNSRDEHQASLARIALEARLLEEAGIYYHGPMSNEELKAYLASLESDS